MTYVSLSMLTPFKHGYSFNPLLTKGMHSFLSSNIRDNAKKNNNKNRCETLISAWPKGDYSLAAC